ncbi:protease 4 [Citrobacter koseri]|uniref:Protease 4 n=1 Tax=Citrobacter koseri TaxID=545 RepID=A0A3S4MBQ9_CITKO|nr:protease 4 [Citrobacter koseri]
MAIPRNTRSTTNWWMRWRLTPKWKKALTKQFGWSKAENNYRAISYYDYSLKTPADTGDGIGVVFANGAIMDGEETPGNVGGDTTASQIRDARLDPKVKAIVLRVNSPGGSVSASEVIRAELAAAKAAGKPVVVSMGGMAASGGLLDLHPGKLHCGEPEHPDRFNRHLWRYQHR